MSYLKFIEISDVDDSGLSSAYMKRVEIVEVLDSEGNPWEPVPGPDPWDDLVVSQGATWSDSNVYAAGEDITGTSATYVGGTGNEIYRSRVQHKSATDSDWSNSPWTEHLNVPSVIHFEIPAGEENGSVRFQTQARDTTTDPVTQVNSFASVKSIAPAVWGAITQTIEGDAYDPDVDGAYLVTANSPIVCAVSATGPDDITYEWTRRGSDDVLIGTPNAAQTVITFPSQGVFTVTVSIRSGKTAEWESAIFTFMVG